MNLNSTDALLARDPCLWWWLDGKTVGATEGGR